METAVELDPAQVLQLPVETGVRSSDDDAGLQTTGALAACVCGHDPQSDKIIEMGVIPGRNMHNPSYHKLYG